MVLIITGAFFCSGQLCLCVYVLYIYIYIDKKKWSYFGLIKTIGQRQQLLEAAKIRGEKNEGWKTSKEENISLYNYDNMDVLD